MPYKDPEARKRYIKEHYQKNREAYLERSRVMREQQPEKVAAAKKRCYDRVKDDPEFKKRMSDNGKARRIKDREHVRAIERKSYYKHHSKRLQSLKAQTGTPERMAREKVQREIRAGRMPAAKTLACIKCEKPAREYHHHMGYSEEHRLSVVPVCALCHKEIHLADELIGVFGSHSK